MGEACSECGCTLESEQMRGQFGGWTRTWCPDCNITICTRCQRPIEGTMHRDVHGEPVCEGCHDDIGP